MKRTQAAVALIRDARKPANEHPSILETRRLSVSLLVKSTAEEAARRILADAPDDPDDGHWGRNGNALADANLAPARHHEGTLEVPLDEEGAPGVVIAGHFDGLEFFDREGCPWRDDADGANTAYAAIYENKAPKDDVADRPDRIEEYYTQGATYLAMLIEMHDRGIRRLDPAPWMHDAHPIPLPHDLEPECLVLTIQPYTAPEWERGFPLDRAALAKHLAAFRARARAVWESVEAGDPTGPAREFDLKQKAARVPLEDITDDALRGLLVERERITAEAKAIDARKAEIDEVLLARLLPEPERKAKIAGVTVGLVQSRGGVRHYVAAPSCYVQTWGKVKDGGPGEEGGAAP